MKKSEDTTITERILEILKGNQMTSKEIADKINYNEKLTRIYLLRLKKAKKIIAIGKKGRYNIYSLLKESEIQEFTKVRELLYDIAKLYYFICNKLSFKSNIKPSNQDIEFLESIKRKIENEDILKKLKKDL